MCFNTLKIHCNFTLAKKKYRFNGQEKSESEGTGHVGISE